MSLIEIDKEEEVTSNSLCENCCKSDVCKLLEETTKKLQDISDMFDLKDTPHLTIECMCRHYKTI